MLGLLLILLLIGFALVALFWAGSLWFQSYIYNEPAADLHWRAPAAAAAVTLFLALWSFLAYRDAGVGADLLSFTAAQDRTYNHFYSVVVIRQQGKEPFEEKTPYEIRKAGGNQSPEYLVAGSRTPRPWKRTDGEGRLVEAIIVNDGTNQEKKEVRFKLVPPAGGKFGADDTARYVEEGGRRVMLENSIGQVTTQRGWLVVAYLLLNLVHLAIWFACLWLLLRYQWSHALGLALVFWLVMTIWVLPLVLRRAGQLAPPPAAPASAAQKG